MTFVINGTTGATQSASFDSASTFGFKNRIINGAMVIDQRNAGASLSVSANNLVYSLDRWVFQPVSASMSIQRIGSSGGPFSIQINGNAGSAGFNLIQKIESYNVADLASQTVTLSFTVSSTVLTTATAYYQTPTAQDNFNSLNSLVSIGSYAITATPTRQSLTFTLPASAVNGLQLFVINGGALTSGTVTITGVQLEKGSTATSFDYRPYGTELALCKRYFQLGGGLGACYQGGATATFTFQAKLEPQMRAAPSTITVQNGTTAVVQNGRAYANINSISLVINSTPQSAYMTVVSADTGMTANYSGEVSGQAIAYSAEI